MEVPFVDLKVQLQTIRPEIDAALARVLDRAQFVSGVEVAEFEKDFAEFCAAKQAVAVNSGTMALYLALRALDIGPGDEVITVANSFFATAQAVFLVGAKPVFVDVDPDTALLDVAKLDAVYNPKVKAIIPVHLYGQCADMDAIAAWAQPKNIYVIEDACQAHGALYKGRPAGSLADLACFSFYPGKNLGAYGEGGAVTTNNLVWAEKIRALRDHGSPKKYYHDVVGVNGRLEEFQGAILQVKLKKLAAWNEARRAHAQKYRELLVGLPVQCLTIPEYSNPVFHLFVIVTDRRDELQKFLGEKGIHTGIHYPIPLHLQVACQSLGLVAGQFPVAERLAKQSLSLPMFAELTDEQINYVVAAIKEFFSA